MKFFLIVTSIIGLLGSLPSLAVGKLDMVVGGYSLSAKSSQSEGRASGLGSYAATYHYGFFQGLDFSVGYSLFFSNFITGDMGFGPDLGFTFYPISASSSMEVKSENVYMLIKEQWRPLINVSFNQRQFQSSDSSYAGVSVALGTEYSFSEYFDFKGLFRYQLLRGPASSTATFIDFLFGLSFSI